MKSIKKLSKVAVYIFGFQVVLFLGMFVLIQSAMALDSFGTPVDDFESDQDLIADAAAPVVVSSTLDGPDMIGGERDFYINKTLGALNDRLRLNSRSDNEQLTLTFDPTVQGTARISWDGDDNSAVSLAHTGLGGLNLINGIEGFTYSGFHIRFVEGDLAINMTLDVYTDGSNWSQYITQTLIVPQDTPPQSMFIPFSAFTTQAGSGADFADVGAIELEFQSTQSADIVIDLIEVTAMEFGDLPTAYGLTTLADDGARHTIGSLYLGPSRDAEGDGQESAVSNGDDTFDGSDDEDGVVGIGNWNDGDGDVEVTVTGGDGCLSGWLDWIDADIPEFPGSIGGDNDFGQDGGQLGFEEPSEYIIKNQPVVSGTQTITFTFSNPFLGTPVLNVGAAGPFNGRFRLVPRSDVDGSCDDTTAVGLTGSSASGEVEDHQFIFLPSAVSMVDSRASGDNMAQMSLLGLTLALILFSGGYLFYRRWSHSR